MKWRLQRDNLFVLLVVRALLLLLLGSSGDGVGVVGYAVRRDVKADYGARGDGVTDDTNAIILALTDGRGDTPGAPYGATTYNPTTRYPAYVYFPPGKYLVTSSLPIVYNTEVVGDVTDVPTIVFVSTLAASQRVLEVAASWYTDVNQNNFYRQIRNFVIDMTGCVNCVGVHWQVAQATSITNVYFKAGIGTQNQGMWMENGSGGFISDLVFEGGIYGMWVGNQQFTSRNITVRSASMAGIYLNWDWVWTFSSVYVSDCPVAIDVGIATGSLVVIDSKFVNTPIGVRTVYTGDKTGLNSILLDNFVFETSLSSAIIVEASGKTVLSASSGTTTIKSWVQGSVWNNGATAFSPQVDLASRTPSRPGVLVDGVGAYFQKIRPQFVGVTQVDVTTLGVVSNNLDVSSALQQALNTYANTAVLFFPHGIYYLGNTVVIPPGTRMLGEAWSVLMANGNTFSDANNPQPMLQVGTAGQTGLVEMVGLMISTLGPQPGAKLIEWNMHDPSGAPGSCGMWDVHFRIGGAIGTNIDITNCLSSNGTDAMTEECTGAWGLMHITPTGSCYMEGVWGWTADHDIDFTKQINVYNTRGLLVESAGPVWMYGTAMEHNVLYQYNLHNAKNIFMGAIQTETPYYQPSPLTPFDALRTHYADPEYCTNALTCSMAYGLVISNSANVYLYSAGLYSFFNVWNQACLLTSGGPNCQINMVQIDSTSSSLYMYAFNTYGSVYSLNSNYPYSKTLNGENANTFCSGAIVNLNFFSYIPDDTSKVSVAGVVVGVLFALIVIAIVIAFFLHRKGIWVVPPAIGKGKDKIKHLFLLFKIRYC